MSIAKVIAISVARVDPIDQETESSERVLPIDELPEEQSYVSTSVSSYPHPPAIIQQNPFILLFLLLQQHPNLFPKVVNGFEEFFINTICK